MGKGLVGLLLVAMSSVIVCDLAWAGKPWARPRPPVMGRSADDDVARFEGDDPVPPGGGPKRVEIEVVPVTSDYHDMCQRGNLGVQSRAGSGSVPLIAWVHLVGVLFR